MIKHHANEKKLSALAEKMAHRWNLSLTTQYHVAKQRMVYKAMSPHGPVALKLFAQIGAGSEGAAIPFYRALPPGLSPKLYAVSPLRRAILIEWLDGPTLQSLVDNGRHQEALDHFESTVKKLHTTRFRFPVFFPRIALRHRAKLLKNKKLGRNAVYHDTMNRTLALIDHLIATTTQEHVIHGDLHYRNIILTSDGPRLFDPKGYRADPAYEAHRNVFVPFENTTVSDWKARMQQQAAIFALAVDAPPLRLIQWTTIFWAGRVFNGSYAGLPAADIQPYLSALLDVAEA